MELTLADWQVQPHGQQLCQRVSSATAGTLSSMCPGQLTAWQRCSMAVFGPTTKAAWADHGAWEDGGSGKAIHIINTAMFSLVWVHRVASSVSLRRRL